MNSLKSNLYASRASEKARTALNMLARLDKPLRERLVRACMELSMLTGRSLPGKFQVEFDEIRSVFTSLPGETEEEGDIHASIRHLSSEEAEQLVSKIVRFALAVEVATAQEGPPVENVNLTHEL